jgi:hypothetical protein
MWSVTWFQYVYKTFIFGSSITVSGYFLFILDLCPASVKSFNVGKTFHCQHCLNGIYPQGAIMVPVGLTVF